MTFGLRCSGPACRPHPASLPVRVPTVESLPPASFSFASRLHLAVRLRLPSSAPVGSFHPTRFCPCWAHPAAGLLPGVFEALGCLRRGSVYSNQERVLKPRACLRTASVSYAPKHAGRKPGGRAEALTPLRKAARGVH